MVEIYTLPLRVQFANHNVGWMADDCTSNTCNVPTQETHSGLLQTIVALLWLPQILVDLVNCAFERRKLYHRVRDLPSPQRIQALIQPSYPLLRRDFAPALSQGMRKRGQSCLHAHLDCLKRAKGEIGEKLGGGRCSEIDEGFVGIGEHVVAVDMLKDLVEAILTGALEGVADKRWGPAEEHPTDAFCGVDGAPGLDIGAVEFGINLTAAFYLGKKGVSADLSLWETA